MQTDLLEGPRTSSLLDGSISNYFDDVIDVPKVDQIEDGASKLISPDYTTILDKNACVLTEIVFGRQALIFVGTYFNLLSAYSIVREEKEMLFNLKN